MRLLGTNYKLAKHAGRDYAVLGLVLAPHTIGGFDVCEAKTKACVKSCVMWFTGRTVTRPVREAMIRRKQLLLADREAFELQLQREIVNFRLLCKARGQHPAIRLNVASDLDWRHIARRFPDVAFYDYTKVRSRLADANWPANYELTYSRSDASHHRTVGAQLRRGGNVSVVFSTRYWPQGGIVDPLPSCWRIDGKTWRVVDGDRHDVRLRAFDGSGVIVGLRFKGSLKRRADAVQRGFCVAV